MIVNYYKDINYSFTNDYKYLQPKVSALQPFLIRVLLHICSVEIYQQK